MAFQTAAGASFSIIAMPATWTEASVAALSPTIVGEITNIGEFGKEFALVTHMPLATRGVKKRKGSFNNGSLSPTLALDIADAGQLLMEAALAADDPYAMLVTLQDGTEYWMAGLVMNFRVSVGGTDDVVMAPCTIELDDYEIFRDPTV